MCVLLRHWTTWLCVWNNAALLVRENVGQRHSAAILIEALCSTAGDVGNWGQWRCGKLGAVALWETGGSGVVGNWRKWRCGKLEEVALWETGDGGVVGNWRKWLLFESQHKVASSLCGRSSNRKETSTEITYMRFSVQCSLSQRALF